MITIDRNININEARAAGPYLIHHEGESGGGFYDIALKPRLLDWPDIAHAGLIELKYLKPGDPDPTPEALAAIKAEAIDQLDRYCADPALRRKWPTASKTSKLPAAKTASRHGEAETVEGGLAAGDAAEYQHLGACVAADAVAAVDAACHLAGGEETGDCGTVGAQHAAASIDGDAAERGVRRGRDKHRLAGDVDARSSCCLSVASGSLIKSSSQSVLAMSALQSSKPR